MYKFIHICQDEKFINSGYNQFEELYPGQNVLYVYGSKQEELTHIRVERSRIRFVDLTDDFLNDLPEKSILIFHSIPNKILYILPKIRKDVKIIWMMFGFEIYSDTNLYSSDILLDKITKSLFESNVKNYSLTSILKNVIYPYIRLIKKDWRLSPKEELEDFNNRKISALKRVDFFACSYHHEYLNVVKILNFSRPFFNFYYFPLEKMVDIHTEITNNKYNKMVGHSGFPNGNHLDIFHKIKSYDIDFKDMYVPFSYGDANYMATVKKYTTENYPLINFIEDFLPLEEYNKFLQSIKIAVFNNRRQQGIGNIISLLYFGAKVFMSESNTFYQYLSSEGVIIYSYEYDLDDTATQSGLTVEQINHNRNILKALFAEDKLKSDLNGAINRLL